MLRRPEYLRLSRIQGIHEDIGCEEVKKRRDEQSPQDDKKIVEGMEEVLRRRIHSKRCVRIWFCGRGQVELTLAWWLVEGSLSLMQGFPFLGPYQP